MTDHANAGDHELPDVPQQRDDSPYASLNQMQGAPVGARQNVRSDDGRDAVARPGGSRVERGRATAGEVPA